MVDIKYHANAVIRQIKITTVCTDNEKVLKLMTGTNSIHHALKEGIFYNI